MKEKRRFAKMLYYNMEISYQNSQKDGLKGVKCA